MKHAQLVSSPMRLAYHTQNVLMKNKQRCIDKERYFFGKSSSCHFQHVAVYSITRVANFGLKQLNTIGNIFGNCLKPLKYDYFNMESMDILVFLYSLILAIAHNFCKHLYKYAFQQERFWDDLPSGGRGRGSLPSVGNLPFWGVYLHHGRPPVNRQTPVKTLPYHMVCGW